MGLVQHRSSLAASLLQGGSSPFFRNRTRRTSATTTPQSPPMRPDFQSSLALESPGKGRHIHVESSNSPGGRAYPLPIVRRLPCVSIQRDERRPVFAECPPSNLGLPEPKLCSVSSGKVLPVSISMRRTRLASSYSIPNSLPDTILRNIPAKFASGRHFSKQACNWSARGLPGPSFARAMHILACRSSISRVG